MNIPKNIPIIMLYNLFSTKISINSFGGDYSILSIAFSFSSNSLNNLITLINLNLSIFYAFILGVSLSLFFTLTLIPHLSTKYLMYKAAFPYPIAA